MRTGIRTWLLLFGLTAGLYAGGKLTGIVTDAATGQPLPGANILIPGAQTGAAADENGYFVVLNLPPGTYEITAAFVGYARVTVTGVEIYTDLTTTQKFSMRQESLMGETVTVVAEKKIIQRDITGSHSTVRQEEIETLPVTDVQDVVGLKAGITSELGIRGSSPNETVFVVDGVVFKDARTNDPVTGVPLSALQEISIQTGGLSAQYNNVRAGVVSLVTREGDPERYSLSLNTRYSPPAQKHFGISPYDPDSYWLRPYLDDEVCWTGTDNGAWDEYTLRQYPDFSGWESVSAQKLNTPDPSDDLTAAGAQQLFKWQHRREGGIREPDLNVDAGFGGPVPFLNRFGNLRFFASYRYDRNMYVAPQATDGVYEYSGMLNITGDISPKSKLNFKAYSTYRNATASSRGGYSGTMDDVYDVAYSIASGNFTAHSRLWTDNYWSISNVTTDVYTLKFTHMISSASFLNLYAGLTRKQYATGPGPDRDLTLKYEPLPGYFVDEAPVGFYADFLDGIDGMGMGGAFATGRDSSSMDSWSLKADYVGQLSPSNQLKTGFEVIYDDLHIDFGSYLKPLPSGNYWTDFRRYPWRANVYLEDKLEFEGLIATLGLIGEYINPNGQWYDVETYDVAFFSQSYAEGITKVNMRDTRAHFYLTPRLGISHPISETAKLFYNYGHYIQMPASEDLYRIQRYSTNKLITLGDPGLPLARTISYEIGFDKEFLGAYLIRLAAYYKDISDQADVTYFTSTDRLVDYGLITANSYEDIRGLEIEVSKRLGSWLTGSANYEYRVNSWGNFGTQHYYENPQQQKEYDLREPAQGQSLPRPQAKFWADLHTPAAFGPSLAGTKPLADWHFILLGQWLSGRWDTWNPNNKRSVDGAVIVNNIRWRATTDLDLRISKNVRISSGITLKFMADVRNVLNTRHMYSGAFSDYFDTRDYYYSLHLPESVTAELDYPSIPGSDRPGDYRPDDVEFVPFEFEYDIDFANDTGNSRAYYYNAADKSYYRFTDAGWLPADPSAVDELIEKKAYIDMPNQTSFTFLNPRDIFIGLNLSFDLR